MRHRKRTLKLNKTSSHRKALFSNMCNSLIEHELIKTTLPKAKALRSFIEPIITIAKSDSVNNRRKVYAKLRDKSSIGKLFLDLGPRYEERPGGYVRVVKCGYRTGDKAPMAFVEFVDRPEPLDASDLEELTEEDINNQEGAPQLENTSEDSEGKEQVKPS